MTTVEFVAVGVLAFTGLTATCLLILYVLCVGAKRADEESEREARALAAKRRRRATAVALDRRSTHRPPRGIDVVPDRVRDRFPMGDL
jgi:hypothetical protein